MGIVVAMSWLAALGAAALGCTHMIWPGIPLHWFCMGCPWATDAVGCALCELRCFLWDRHRTEAQSPPDTQQARAACNERLQSMMQARPLTQVRHSLRARCALAHSQHLRLRPRRAREAAGAAQERCASPEDTG